MSRVMAGAGGWGYFSGGLGAYARAFDFVEANVTFYRHVSDGTARRWRGSVPSSFAFAVKAHREVTHRGPLRATAAARNALARTVRTAGLLRAPFIILETPASSRFDQEESGALRELSGMLPAGIRLGLEARAHAAGPLPPDLARVMADLGILDVVDLSRSSPRIEGETIYTRVFGKGEFNAYQLDDEEMREIDRIGRDAATVAYAFHGVRMYKDAARFITFRETGTFPPVTGSLGLDSLAEVLEPDARFPATRSELRRDHGWKLVDQDPTHRTHADKYLARLPDATFADLGSVLRALTPA